MVTLRGSEEGAPSQKLWPITDNLARFPNCLLLTRVGQFYESYFSQAAEIASLLHIKLTTRKWGGRRVPMCGFPIAHLDKYLRMLVQGNQRLVAMCEEFPVDKRELTEGRSPRVQPTRTFERRVTRVITPGTLIDEPFLNQYENNYLLAVTVEKPKNGRHSASTVEQLASASATRVGLAWIDVSTGEFFSKVSSLDALRDELARIGPKEVVLDKKMEELARDVLVALAEEQYFVSYQSSTPTADDNGAANETGGGTSLASTEPDDLLASDVAKATSTSSTFTPLENTAVTLLTAFLRAHLREHMPVLGVPVREEDARLSPTSPRMHLDAHTLRALEIREGMREGGARGSLLSAVRRTRTTGGTRLLARWLAAPSLSLPEITARHALVEFFLQRPHLRADLSSLLTSIPDAGRLSQKLMLGKGDAGDVRAVGRAIRAWARVAAVLREERSVEAYERMSEVVAEGNELGATAGVNEVEWASLDALMRRMDGLEELEERIASALEGGREIEDDDAIDAAQMGFGEEAEQGSGDNASNEFATPATEDPRWTIRPDFSPTLTDLHVTLQGLWERREKMEAELQLRYAAPSLTLRSSPALGMHVHLARRRRDSRLLDACAELVRVAESGSTKAYFWAPWTELGSEIVDRTLDLQAAEREAFDILRREVSLLHICYPRNARVLDELDVSLGFAALAAERGYVRPIMSERCAIDVTPTTLCCPTPTARLHILTGPNMAGKSTVLRQTALIAILAQAGSFVPAAAAHLGLVDAVFARVGARDDLSRDRSTFMVEMLETGAVLRRATERSLVIMDEIGRGTAFRDGLAIAFATVVHLVKVNKCRALFATHFADHTTGTIMTKALEGDDQTCDEDMDPFHDVAFFCTDVVDADPFHVAYAYRLRPGVNRRSHALRVAALAGVPPTALAVAEETLGWLEKQHERVLPAGELRALGKSIAVRQK
ncbi:muts domain V-domain-containing protein [Schizophyllum amplum]|uniref:Muts domain V-domain-containing protein n=1 Tax=Schizophyllum amplum TaxID=97359 RepID=A0A550C9K3_9AGAR|nr:muts domain V-domain-containing protein [Auriculariopsis ampla]